PAAAEQHAVALEGCPGDLLAQLRLTETLGKVGEDGFRPGRGSMRTEIRHPGEDNKNGADQGGGEGEHPVFPRHPARARHAHGQTAARRGSAQASLAVLATWPRYV